MRPHQTQKFYNLRALFYVHHIMTFAKNYLCIHIIRSQQLLQLTCFSGAAQTISK